MERNALLTMIRQTFDDQELRDLCFELGIDYENLPGEGKASKARELVSYCERHGRLDELEATAGQLAVDLAQGTAPRGQSPARPPAQFDMRGATIGKQINVEGDYYDQSTTIVGGDDSAKLAAIHQDLKRGVADLKSGQRAIYRRLRDCLKTPWRCHSERAERAKNLIFRPKRTDSSALRASE